MNIPSIKEFWLQEHKTLREEVISLKECQLDILNNIVSDNWVGAADLFDTGSGGWGGGIAIYGSVKTCAGIFLDSTLASISNTVVAKNDFGGIHLSLSSPKIVNNTIVYNKQDGIDLSNVFVPTLINNILAFNARDGTHEDSYGDDPDVVSYNVLCG